jgi:two-component system, response regulator YesN
LGVKEYVMKQMKKKEFVALINDYMINIKKIQSRTKNEIIRNIENNKIVNQMKHDFLVGLLSCPNSQEANKYLNRLKSIELKLKQ